MLLFELEEKIKPLNRYEKFELIRFLLDLVANDEADVRQTAKPVRSAAGMLSKYANPALIAHEQEAWERAVREKYANR